MEFGNYEAIWICPLCKTKIKSYYGAQDCIDKVAEDLLKICQERFDKEISAAILLAKKWQQDFKEMKRCRDPVEFFDYNEALKPVQRELERREKEKAFQEYEEEEILP